MSYILDALKKAEQKRHLASKVPTLATVHRAPASTDPGRRLWPWIAGGMILVNGAALVWLLSPVPVVFTRGSASSTETPAPSAPPTAPEHPAVASQSAIPVTRQDKPDREAARARPVETKVTVPAAPAPAASRAEIQKPKPTDAGGAPPTAPGATAAGKIAALPERPAPQAVTRGPVKPAEQRAGPAAATPGARAGAPDGMPAVKLQMLVYSDVPSERLVFINDHKYVEGSSIDGNLVVESITPDGAVLSYQGKRFLLRQ